MIFEFSIEKDMTKIENASFKVGVEYFNEMWHHVVNGFSSRYDSDNPLRSLNTTNLPGVVVGRDALCRALGLIWVCDAQDIVLYGRERTLNTVAKCVDEFNGIHGDYVQRGLNVSLTRQKSDDIERREVQTLMRMRNKNKLMHVVAVDYPSVRDWGSTLEIDLLWGTEVNGLKCGPA